MQINRLIIIAISVVILSQLSSSKPILIVNIDYSNYKTHLIKSSSSFKYFTKTNHNDTILQAPDTSNNQNDKFYYDVANNTNIIEINKKANTFKQLIKTKEPINFLYYSASNIIYSSNHVKDNYFKIYNTNNQQTKTIPINMFIDNIVSSDHYCYVFSSTTDNKYYILTYNKNNFKHLKTRQLDKAPNQTTTPIINNNIIYYLENNNIIIFDTIKKTTKKIMTNLTHSAKISIYNNKLYLTNANLSSLEIVQPLIFTFDFSTKQSQYIKIHEPATDYHIFNKTMIVLGQRNITYYDLKTIKLTKKIDLKDNGIYTKILY